MLRSSTRGLQCTRKRALFSGGDNTWTLRLVNWNGHLLVQCKYNILKKHDWYRHQGTVKWVISNGLILSRGEVITASLLPVRLPHIVYVTSIVSFYGTSFLNGTYEGFSNFFFMSNLTDFELSPHTNLGLSQETASPQRNIKKKHTYKYMLLQSRTSSQLVYTKVRRHIY